jgi:hypothetical protein
MYLSTNAEYGTYLYQNYDKNKRGINVYSLSEIQNIVGQDKSGKRITAEVQLPIFILTPWERENLARLNSDILGLLIARMNKISSLDWNIKRKKNEEDRIAETLKSFQQIYNEYDDPQNMKNLIIRRKCLINIKEELKEVKDDLSNFDSSLRRWRKRIKRNIEDSSQKIVDWVNSANIEDDFEEFKKKWVFDLMIHGSEAIYKQYTDGLLENIYTLPGGSVYPLRSEYVGSLSGYVQMMPGYDPKIYFSDEMIFDNYVPISARSYGLIPLEALLNKIAESLLFDRLAAERADGTKPPEKLVILGDNSKMFNLNDINFEVPVDQVEQKRVETIINEERKNAVRVLSGVGTPVIVDVSKADTFAQQSERQEKLKKDIALVFSATPIEMGLAGSEDISGRATSESQERIERERGVFPIIKIIDKTMSNKIIPYRFGSGWLLNHETGLTEAEQLKLEIMKIQSDTYSVNEIREERGEEPYPEEVYNRPRGISPQQQQVGANELNPMYIRDLK